MSHCTKVKYRTYQDAIISAQRQLREKGFMHPFKCTKGGKKHYHLGHSKGTKAIW